jgi:hypothetical protein
MRFFDDVVKTITQNRKNGLQTNRNWFRETGSKAYNGFNGLVSSRLGKKLFFLVNLRKAAKCWDKFYRVAVVEISAQSSHQGCQKPKIPIWGYFGGP